MPSSSSQRQQTPVNIGLVIGMAVFCLVLVMLFLARSGKADAGIGQPVTLGPPQVVPTGPGPHAISFFSTNFHDAVLAIANNDNDTVSVVPQDFPGGTFQPATNYSLPAGAHPQSVAVATRFTSTFPLQNFIAVADTGLNKVSVLLKEQSTTDTFKPPVNYDVGTSPQDVAIGRVVGDDNFDIVTANFGSNNVTILTGNSNGTFGNALTVTVNTQPRAVALGTIDNNTSTDIVTCSSTGLVTVLRANGGSFTAVTHVVGVDARDIALGDFDQDGHLDIVTANGSSNNVSILINDGSGGFSFANSYPAGLNPRSVAVGDLNLDGKPDLAVASAGNGLNILLNNGDGTFAPPVNFSMGQSPFGVAVGSFQQGRIGVATANHGDGTVTIRLNTTVPLLTFASPIPHGANSAPYSVATFDHFGRLGLAITSNDPNFSFVSVLYRPINGVNGAFNATNYSLIPGSQPEQVVVANLGQISIPSLVVALPNANKVGILLGNSDETFQTPFYKNVGTFPRSVALADFNSDGNLDIAAANFASFTVSIILGNADRTFRDAYTIAGVLSANPEFIVAGDFNNDGKADIATCNSGPPTHNKVNVLLGNGNGSFQPLNVYTVGLSPRFMTTGDFNDDGNLDLAVSDTGQNQVSVLLNNGSGVFQAASHYAVGLHPHYLATGDFNLDGQTDLAVSNRDSKTFSVLLNNGDGTFKDALSFTVGLGPIGIAVADFDFDNKPDVVTANHEDGTFSLVLNTSTPPPIPAPPNDNFADAEMLEGFSGRTTGTNVGATIEKGEPAPVSFRSNSVWYSWTAPADGGATIDTFESSFNTLLAVYTGNDLATLTPIVSNNNDLSPAGDVRVTSKVKFNAVSGTTYKITVSSFSPSNGNITLNWALLPPPANDNFADAQTISGASGVVVGTNAGATKEQGEPNHADNAGGASLWYRWTAPSNGLFTFNTSSSKIGCDTTPDGCSYDTLLAVYLGSSLQEISQPQNLVAKNDNEPQRVSSLLSFSATAGTTYQIAVDSKGNLKSDIVLSWFAGAASHDSFATALQITGSSGSSSVEPASNGESWFRWVAPESGTVTFFSKEFVSPANSKFEMPSTISVFSVSGQSIVQPPLGENTERCIPDFANQSCPSSHVTFAAVAQAEYAIRILKPFGAIGLASLSWSFGPAPLTGLTNDSFAGAQVITGFGGNLLNFDNTSATKEPGEPDHGGNPGGHSLWFSWTAPDSFQVTFSTIPQSFQNIFVGAYTGTTVSTLSSVAEGSPSLTFKADKDTTYHIAVDSQIPGKGFLSWNPINAPPNDNFGKAQVLDGSSGKVLGTNINATTEFGEPSPDGFFTDHSIWYTWIAPSNGFFTFNTDRSDTDTILSVYSMVSNTFSRVVSNDNDNSNSTSLKTSRVTFFALAGQEYKIAVSGFSTGTIRLQWGLARNIGGRITNIRGVGIANTTVSMTGDANRTRITDTQGFYNFPDVPEGGIYVVTPGTASYTYDVTSRTYNSLMADITDANFVAVTPVYSIAGRITAGGVGVANITVNLTGTINTSVSTNSLGVYTFPNLTTNGDYTVQPSSAFYTFSTFSSLKDRYFFPGLNDNYAGVNFTATAVPAPPIQLVLEESASVPNQAAAVDAVLLVRDPFPVVSSNVLVGPNVNTRVLIFVSNLQLAAGETPAAVIVVHLVDSQMHTFDVAAENLVTLPGFNFSQLIFSLPDGLAAGTCTIEVRAHGETSNIGTIQIR